MKVKCRETEKSKIKIFLKKWARKQVYCIEKPVFYRNILVIRMNILITYKLKKSFVVFNDNISCKLV